MDINSIPFPARDLVPYRNYGKTVKYQGLRTRAGQRAALGVMSLISDIFIDDMLDKSVNFLMKTVGHTPASFPAGAIVTSRSCSSRCTFCSIRKVWGDIYRMRSAENVIEEIALLREKYGIRHLAIQDDNFTVSKKRIIKICKAIIENKFNLTLEIKPFFKKYQVDYEIRNKYESTKLRKGKSNIKYIGHVPQKELYKYYSQGSVFVIMSIEEGLAMVQPQAMACGLPVICTTNTGGENIVRDGKDGFVIPIRDVEKLKEKLVYLYENPEICRKMGESAKQRVSQGFTWDDYGDKIINIYENILTQKL